MNDRKQPDKQISKFEEAKGLFWGASLFIGALIAVIIGFGGNGHSDWIFAGIAGGLVFLTCGLISQGILTLLKKEK